MATALDDMFPQIILTTGFLRSLFNLAVIRDALVLLKSNITRNKNMTIHTPRGVNSSMLIVRSELNGYVTLRLHSSVHC